MAAQPRQTIEPEERDFAELDGKTQLTLRGSPINCTEEGRKAYLRLFASMQQGFGGTFDKLDAYLASVTR